MNTKKSSVCLATYTTVHSAIDRFRNDGEKKMALLMYCEELSSVLSVWTDLGTLGEQSRMNIRWFARHIMVTHGSCTFFSQSCQDLLRVLRTIMVLLIPEFCPGGQRLTCGPDSLHQSYAPLGLSWC